ncbi:hypothetical protein V6N11_033861 [Hibiscus sabdariffa]|uniref:Uncharacterized protein n=1 Tax=Hibiscus sabdariffa TaxID=183260 RepID=A0ABR2S1L7_9ROSI
MDFWRDRWLEGFDPLITYVDPHWRAVLGHPIVDEMVTDLGVSAWDSFAPQLLVDVVRRIAALHGILSSLGSDMVGWSAGKDGQFSVKPTYSICCGPFVSGFDGLWKRINKFWGLQWVKVFLCLICHERVMNNVERVRRHFATDASCPLCGFREESVFTLTPELPSCIRDWDLFFGYMVWSIWLSRNAMVFDNPMDDKGSILERSMRLRNLLGIGRLSGQVELLTGCRNSIPTATGPLLLLHIDALCNRVWEIQYQQVSCSDNSVADRMASLADSGDFEVHKFPDPPLAVVDLLVSDGNI